MSAQDLTNLALYGASPARQRLDPPVCPGGTLIAEQEEQAALDARA